MTTAPPLEVAAADAVTLVGDDDFTQRRPTRVSAAPWQSRAVPQRYR